jgi:hypothetical protein
MENEKYIFNLNAMEHQPKGFVDFSKIYNPKTIIITYTDLKTNKKEFHIIEKKMIFKN